MADTGGQDRAGVKKLLEIYSGRLKIQKELKDMSLKMKEEMEKNHEESAEAVDILTEQRDVLIEKIKEADTAARYGEDLLSEKHTRIIKEVKYAVKNNTEPAPVPEWAGWLYKNLSEYKSGAAEIRALDEKNAETIKILMETIKGKIKGVKENKNITSKFSDDFTELSIGTFMNEKK